MDKIKRNAFKVQQKFTMHPHKVKQTYSQHMLHSLKKSVLGCGVSIAYLIHACFPFMFKDLCSSNEEIYNDSLYNGSEIDS